VASTLAKTDCIYLADAGARRNRLARSLLLPARCTSVEGIVLCSPRHKGRPCRETDVCEAYARRNPREEG
jgi:hypothetical protein